MLLNSLLCVGLIVICFGGLLLAKKFFGEGGIYAWIAIASIASNITAASVGPMFGLHGVTLANVSFLTVFIGCQMLTVCYGLKAGRKGVYVGLFSSISFILIMITCSQLTLCEDTYGVTQAIQTLFSLDSFGLCNTVASVLMFYVANILDVYLFDKLNKKLSKKYMWVSSVVAVNICNCLENFAFVFLGMFLFPLLVSLIPGSACGPESLSLCLDIAITTCLVELVLGLLAGPMVHLAQKIKSKGDANGEISKR